MLAAELAVEWDVERLLGGHPARRVGRRVCRLGQGSGTCACTMVWRKGACTSVAVRQVSVGRWRERHGGGGSGSGGEGREDA